MMGFLLFVPLGFLVLFVTVNKFWCFWCRSKVCLVGKTAIVTGGASGIGFQIALGLAAKGCRVIVADVVNLEAVEELKKLNMKVDLQSFKSVREFAKAFIESEERLDILVCNAGTGIYREGKRTEDGLEKTMQVNYFSHFLLIHLLLNLLKKSAPSRITFTSSILAFMSDLQIDKLNPSPGYYQRLLTKINGGTYSNSKLCMAAAAKLFGEKLEGTGVTSNAVFVGGVKTPIYWTAVRGDNNYYALLLMAFVFLYGKTPEEGAQTLLHVSHADEVKDVTGQQFLEGLIFPPPWKLTDEFCRKLWDASVKFTKLQPQEVLC